MRTEITTPVALHSIGAEYDTCGIPDAAFSTGAELAAQIIGGYHTKPPQWLLIEKVRVQYLSSYFGGETRIAAGFLAQAIFLEMTG